MRKLYVLSAIALLLTISKGQSQTLLHYWNFNNNTTQGNLLTPNVSLVSSPSIVHETGGTSAINLAITDQGFEVANVNARNGDAYGTHLRFDNPGSGGSLLFSLPTTGYKDVVVKYTTRRSNTAVDSQIITYTTDGSIFTPLTTLSVGAANPTLTTLDFSSIDAVDNNPNFKIRISFGGTGTTAGNHRFDNFTVDGTPTGADITPPTIAFDPLNSATGVVISSNVNLTFNEDARLVDNSAIDDTNVDALVELRLNDAAGSLVAFDATISGKVITINPTANLVSNQLYYVALKANVVEDLADNAISTVLSSVFTTLEPQTNFTAGDLVLVAYRMNATGTPDEVAFLALVDILPSTLVNFTDAKYTDNAQPQCPGGFTWKAPAAGVSKGTVVSIQTDTTVPVPSVGTVTGPNFGLGSGGDQVIVYTGTPAAPNYITALSSNLWLLSNTNCSQGNSKIPAGLVDGQTSINLSTAPGNVSGNTTNAYYSGVQSGSTSELRTAILNPANWTGVAGSTAPQTWPVWSFSGPPPPSVLSAAVVSQTSLKLTFNVALNPTTSVDLLNYTGIADLQSATLSGDAKAVTLVYSTPFSIGSAYSLVVSNVTNTDNVPMSAPYTFAFTYSTTIAFEKKFVTVNEQDGSVSINLLVKNPSTASINVVAKAAPWSTAAAADYTFTSQTITLTGASALIQTITIPVINDTEGEQDEYFVLSLESPTGVAVTGSQYITVFIKDNDRKAPIATKAIELSLSSSYSPPVAGTAEIVVHDPATQRLFIISSIQDRLDIVDFSNPAAVTHIKSIDMTPYGGITSVATKNGIVAAASPNATPELDGSVVFFNTNGDFLKQVTVGALPDMVTFTPDGKKVLTANEGQPNDSYSVDPEGSVSVIDITGGIPNLTQANVSTLLFTGFNSQEAALISAGVRKLKLSSTLSQDFEPEYVTVSADSKKAWVTIQESNAIAELNLETNTYTSVWPLGKKDYSIFGNGLDASDNNGVILNSNWPVKGFYLPDGIANYSVGTNQYLVTANEGDEKEYSGLTERTTVGAVNLDPTIFPNAAVLKETHNLGRLRMTNLSGDTDGDNDYDEINIPGSRSFTIWNAATKTKVFDSGDQFEMITAADPTFGGIFNSDHESNSLKNRSRAKGPEPEGVAVASFNNKAYAFVSLERVGGVMVYDVTDPAAVKFVDYKNNRGATAFTGDHGPEGITFVSKETSPDGKRYILIANEISGTVSVFQVVGKDDQTINFPAIADKASNAAPFTLNATASSALDVTFTTTDDEVTIALKQVTIVKPGRVTIKANQAGNASFNAAPLVEQSFCVNPPQPVITLNGASTENAVLSSSASAGNQWYKNGTLIVGATNQTYTISSAGIYTVQVSVQGCLSPLSETKPIIVTDIIPLEKNELSIYPNPAHDNIVLTLPDTGSKEILVYSLNGAVAYNTVSETNEATIHLANLSDGYFIVKVKTSQGIYFGKFIKH